MNNQNVEQTIIHCGECRFCFKNRRSKTGYSCEKWGYDDFADDTTLDGYCHKAKPKCDRDNTFRRTDT